MLVLTKQFPLLYKLIISKLKLPQAKRSLNYQQTKSLQAVAVSNLADKLNKPISTRTSCNLLFPQPHKCESHSFYIHMRNYGITLKKFNVHIKPL